MVKKAILLMISIALIVNFKLPTHANVLVAANQNLYTPTPFAIPSTIQTRSTESSFKSFEAKINNILKPEKILPKLTEVVTGNCGKSGSNVTWKFDTNTGKLTISGTGDMASYSSSASVPWYSYCSSIKTVVIENGVTSIANYTFYHCSGLTSITVPDSVTTIDYEVFKNCSNLTFIAVGLNNSNYQSIDGVLFNKSGTTLVVYPDGKTGSYTIPNSVTTIGDTAFSGCSGLTSITIPDSVTSIGHSTFYDCSSLTSVAILGSVTFVGTYAFYNCSKLASITIPNSVTSIGEYAFFNCSGLTSVTIGNSVSTIGESAFRECAGLTSITIPDSVTFIDTWAFYYCKSLTSVTVGSNNSNYQSIDGVLFNKAGTTLILYPSGKSGVYSIPDSVTKIEFCAFSICSGLTSITIPDSVTTIGNSAFCGCSGLTSVSISNAVTYIGYSVFEGCSGLTSITIPDSVTSIYSSAFKDCSGLTSVTIPDSVTTIGGRVFSSCSSLTSIIVDSNNSNYQSIDGVLFNKAGTTLLQCPSRKSGNYSIPDSVTTIGDYTFFGCDGLTSITIPDSVTAIGEMAFSSCLSLTSIIVDSNNSNYQSIDGVLFNKAGTTLLQCPGRKSDNYSIPDSVTTIGERAFSSCSGLTSIIVNSNNSNYQSIDGVLFNKNATTLICCPAGKTGSLTIPDSVKTISYTAFYGCKGLTSVSIPKSVTYIGYSVFEDCTELTSVTYKGTSNPDASFSDVFYGTKVNYVNVPCNYTGTTFCGKKVRKLCPSRKYYPQNNLKLFLPNVRQPIFLGICFV